MASGNLSWGGGMTSGTGRGGKEDRNQDATTYCGNLDNAVTEELLWELMLQAGPVIHVHVPRDRITNDTQGFGFVEFRSEEDADYAIKIMNMVKLFGKPIRVNKASQDRKSQDVGANLFIGNLDEQADDADKLQESGYMVVVCPAGLRSRGATHRHCTARVCQCVQPRSPPLHSLHPLHPPRPNP